MMMTLERLAEEFRGPKDRKKKAQVIREKEALKRSLLVIRATAIAEPGD